MNAEELTPIIRQLKLSSTDDQFVEVKESAGKLPASVIETVSAFANGSGGVIVLGLSERNDFEPAEGFDAHRVADALSQACSDKLTPPVRADIEIVEYGGSNVLVASVEEILPRDKPCYITDRGMYKGSFIRSFDGDRKLSAYEIDRLLEDRTQPAYDAEIVTEATMDDLDQGLLDGVISRQKALHPRVFANFDDEEIMTSLRIAAKDDDGVLRPTLAGLLALGVYPQKYFPRLTVTFAAYPEKDKASVERIKYLDSEKMVGPIPAIIADTIRAVQRNTRLGGALTDAKRTDMPDYPLAAVREAVCNALMHRDYSKLARGTQVQVNLYEDRLEFLSPGGLYGTVTAATVATAGYSSTRNQYLSDILESTPYEGGFVAENRGTGFKLMKMELERNEMDAPVVRDSIAMFSLEFRRKVLPALASDDPCDEILVFVAKNEPCSANEISKGLNVPRSTVTYRLKKLVEENKIKRIGVEKSKYQKYCLM